MLTGVYFAGNDPDPDDDDDDTNPPDPDPVDPCENKEDCKRVCRKTTRDERKGKYCDGEEWDFEEFINKKGKRRRKCCQYIPPDSQSV